MKAPKGLKFFDPIPYLHQRISVGFGIERNGAGLFLDMGLGKTRTAIEIARYRIKQNKINKILVICPTVMLYSWQKEIRKWSEYDSIVCHDPNRSNRIRLLQHKQCEFYIVNYDTLFPYYDYLPEVDMIIWDESSRYLKGIPAKRKETKDKNGIIRVKNATGFSSDRSGVSVMLSDKAQYRLILTGTPVAHNVMNIWTQFRCMDLGETYGKNFYAWRNHYFFKPQRKWSQWKLKTDQIDSLNERMYINAIRFTKEDELPDLPKKTFSEISVQLEGKTKSLYNEMKNELIESEMKARQNADYCVTIRGELAKLIKAAQITAGFLVTDGGNIVEIKDPPKLNALSEFIEIVLDQEESVVVGFRFRPTLSIIEKRLKKMKIPYLTISGKNSNKSFDISREFQTNNKIPVMLCQVTSGIGIEFFKEKAMGKQQHTIIYEQEWELDARDQLLDRIHRIGQTVDCNYVDLYTADTIDEHMLDSLKQHQNIAEMVAKQGVLSFI